MSGVLARTARGAFVLRTVRNSLDSHVLRSPKTKRLWKGTNGFAVTSIRRLSNDASDDGREGAPKNQLDDFLSNDVEQLLEKLAASTSTDNSASMVEASERQGQNGWITINWEQFSGTTPEESPPYQYRVSRKETMLKLLRVDEPSPVEGVLIRDRVVYLKRDDLLRLPGSSVSGNKARKMYALNQIPATDFPDAIVSYGGPQSNAMMALAAVVHSKNLQLQSDRTTTPRKLFRDEMSDLDPNNKSTRSQRVIGDEGMLEAEPAPLSKTFIYYTKKLPRFLRNQPNGNLFRALSLGMEIVEVTNEEYRDLFGSESGGRPEPPPGLIPPCPNSLWVPQGGACGMAVPGGRRMANEIVSFWSQQGHGRPLSVCVPGGTCSTAALLHREIRKLLDDPAQKIPSMDIRVVVIPCVGGDGYARRQMISLNLETSGDSSESDIPAVLAPATSQQRTEYFRFGEPDAAILKTFREMKDEHGVDVDLLYGAPAWTLLLQHWREVRHGQALMDDFDEDHPLAGREIMYVHSGGLEGITSQLMRYKYKGLVQSHEIQLPGRAKKSVPKTGL